MTIIPQEFGSGHTEAKLATVEKYLKAFTTALTGKFELVYVDAFAGSGASVPKSDKKQFKLIETDDIIHGSTMRALNITPSFNRYVFIEKLSKNLRSLESVKTEYPEKADLIDILPGDANKHLAQFADKINRKNARAVVFIDPFGLSLSWETIALLGKTERVDLWYLVPSAGMSRQVKMDGVELDSAVLNDKVLGTPDWRGRIIDSVVTTDLFGQPVSSVAKIGGALELSAFVQERLATVFKGGVSRKALPLGRNGRHEFSLIFACANPSPRASALALKLADAVLGS